MCLPHAHPCSVSALLALSEQLRLLQVGSTRAQICLVSQRRRSLSTKAERESLEYFAERRYVYIYATSHAGG